MNYEEKYNEALKRAKELIAKWTGKNKDFYIEDYSYIFPELRESEDERIREWLVDYFKAVERACIHWDISPERIVSYLEKKKEIPLMNGDADLYFDEWNQQKPNPTKRQCFEEGMKYAQRLQKEQEHICDSAHMRNDSNR